jgi:hypothetical protein
MIINQTKEFIKNYPIQNVLFMIDPLGLKAEVSVHISYEGKIGKICKREKYYMKLYNILPN